jgi:thiosulfate/3-mercaptopyruvate sulfurtransferase
MSVLIASLSRRAFAAAVLASIAVAAMPAVGAETVEPLVSAQWLKDHQADPQLVVLDVRSAIDGGGAEAYAKAHIPGAVHSDYDKAGWRVTRNGVPFMLPTTPNSRS